MKKIAIMQPYFLPYLGYFQLVSAVDNFIFYDDVQYIKGGWINRNNILVNNEPFLFSIPLIKASPNKCINDIYVNKNHPSFKKVERTFINSYANAPYFEEVKPLVETIFQNDKSLLSEFAAHSVKIISSYLGLETSFEFSSIKHPESKGLEKSERLISIINKEGGQTYINPYGGMELYDKSTFIKRNIVLDFIKPKSNLPSYPQQSQSFVPNLSIIDLLMHVGKLETRSYLHLYELL